MASSHKRVCSIPDQTTLGRAVPLASGPDPTQLFRLRPFHQRWNILIDVCAMLLFMSVSFERQLRRILEDHEFIVFRSAGSRSVDLIAIHKSRGVFLIEEKSIGGNVYRTTRSAKEREQWQAMCALAKSLMKDNPFEKGSPPGYFVFYAIHKSRGGYRLILAEDLDKPYHWSEDPAPAVPLEDWL